MQNFTFYAPTKIIFGRDTIPQIGEALAADGISRAVLVAGGGSIFKNGVHEAVTESLKKHGIHSAEIGGVRSNPRLSKLRDVITLLKGEKAEAVLAVGGGSVFDTAKAAAMGALYDGDVWDFFCGKAAVKEALPVYGVLTASGTSSEMNNTAVVTREEDESKWAIASPVLVPKVSVIDPSVQATLPESQTVSGGIDAITHVLEAYVISCPGLDFVQDYCESLIRAMMRRIPQLVKNPGDYEARAELAWCCTLAHNGLSNVGRPARGDFASHRIEHSLSAIFDVPHGTGLAIIMPAWMEYVYRDAEPVFERLAANIFGVRDGEGRALRGIRALREYFRSLGSPVTLREVGVAKNDLPGIADNAAKLAPLGAVRKIEREDILQILETAY